MNADNYPPLNVLSVVKGFDRAGLQHHITPYRIQNERGESLNVKEVRQVTQHMVGGKLQYRYTVRTEQDFYLYIFFDAHTFTWRLIREVRDGVVTIEYEGVKYH